MICAQINEIKLQELKLAEKAEASNVVDATENEEKIEDEQPKFYRESTKKTKA